MRTSTVDLNRSPEKGSLEFMLLRYVCQDEPLSVTAYGRHIQRAIASEECPDRSLGPAPQHGEVGMQLQDARARCCRSR